MKFNVYLKRDFVKRFMLDNDISKKELSESLKISTASLYNLLKDKYEPHYTTQVKIKNFFIERGYKINEVFDIVEKY